MNEPLRKLKGHLVDGRNATKQAREHLHRMARATEWIARKVRKAEMGILMALLAVMAVGGCSGGISVSAGGSIHDPKHPDLANIVEATPILTTRKDFALPMVGK